MCRKKMLAGVLAVMMLGSSCYMGRTHDGCGRSHHFRLIDSAMVNGKIDYYLFRCQRYNCTDTDTFPKVSRNYKNSVAVQSILHK